jgi:hypothetical protein
MKSTFKYSNDRMKKYFLLLIVLGFYLEQSQIFAQQVVLNEVMSSNGITIPDEDGSNFIILSKQILILQDLVYRMIH